MNSMSEECKWLQYWEGNRSFHLSIQRTVLNRILWSGLNFHWIKILQIRFRFFFFTFLLFNTLNKKMSLIDRLLDQWLTSGREECLKIFSDPVICLTILLSELAHLTSEFSDFLVFDSPFSLTKSTRPLAYYLHYLLAFLSILIFFLNFNFHILSWDVTLSKSSRFF